MEKINEQQVNEQNSNLNEIWRICRKIQNVIFKYGYRILDYYKFHDENHIGLISESKFVNILGQLKNIIGLSEYEIGEITDYFRLPDGRIAYKQFCDVISEDQNRGTKPDLVSGLEWNDPLHVNTLSEFDKRRLCILLVKIAQIVRLRDIVLLPYFQDYDLIAKNSGTVTIPHFSRVLHFMKINLSENDFILLMKRYLKDSYTVNYVAFIKDIEAIVKFLDSHRLIDFSEDIIKNFPGRLIDIELPKLPRPEIGTVRTSDVFGKETSFHSTFNKWGQSRKGKELFLRIQRHILDYQIHIHDFFGNFDLLKSGYITKNQFLRALDNIGVSGLHHLYLTQDELEIVCQMYVDPNDPDRINWKQFEEDMNKVFLIPNLEKKPYQIVTTPPTEVVELQKTGQENWKGQNSKIKDLCEEATVKIKAKIKNRGLYFLPFFQAFDKCKTQHVSRSQMRQILITNGILLSDEEFYALEKRYNNDTGFNYVRFLSEVDPKDFIAPQHNECFMLKPKTQTSSENKLDIINVLAKVKRQVVTKRVRILDFLKDYDKLNHEYIHEKSFRRGLDNSNIKLSNDEMDVLCEIFKTPFQNECVDYKRFCKIVDEVFYQESMEKTPLIVPLQHFPSTDCDDCFLNFEERTILSNALRKLSKMPDHISNLSSLFEDYDRQNCGTVTTNQFLRALTTRDLMNLISRREFDMICKGFGIERGHQIEVKYRSFVKNLDILFEMKEKYP